MRLPRHVYLLPLLMVTCVCSNKLGGDLKVNGKPFGADGCRNGSVRGFSGVEISGDGGRLRIIQTPTGEAQVVLFAPGVQIGADFGVCGTIQVSDQNSTINDVKNIQGKATLKCAADAGTVEGTVTFENCH